MGDHVLVLQVTELTYRPGVPHPEREVKAVYRVPKDVDYSAVRRFLEEYGFAYEGENLAMLHDGQQKGEPGIRFGAPPLDPPR